ncbi:LysR family transcriptional regulator [Pigmentiphaga sp.]|uniref:LysR family transcriptional regulator n=1 Tax=Pigmentiphaga sp. TaxID=1977564 RepID=UPI0025D78D42|nr:LysR family transcriptional regulator [Pigmentiphaga sp.]
MTPLGRLTFQHMLYLQALVEERHVTRAAARAGIGQPAMSAALARLRKTFHDPLLVKTAQGMTPTPCALELAQRVKEITSLIDERGAGGGNFHPATAARRWRIMASDSTLRSVLPGLMRQACREAPGMHFTVQPGDPRRIAEYLREGDFDLIISFVPNPSSDLHQTVLYPQRLMCIARDGHPALAAGLTLETFVAQPHARWGVTATIPSTLEELVDDVLRKLGQARQTSLQVANLTLLPDVVANSELLAVVPEHLALNARNTLPIQILPLPFAVPAADISMIWHERSHNDPAHRWLRNALRHVGGQLALRPLVEDQPT